jgi:hypothetical protein
MINPIGIGRPGIPVPTQTTEWFVFVNGEYTFLPGGKVIDGAKARDPGNSPDTRTLRPGLLMGRVTASGKYANSTIGLTQAAILANATSLTLTAAAALELQRRVGATGNLVLIGPPTASGTVASQTVAYSAINTTTGVVTTSAIPAAVVTASRVAQGDGSEIPLTLIGDGYGLRLAETGDDEFPRLPISGFIDEARIIDWPADPAARAALRSQLSSNAGGKFVFTGQY